MLKVEQSNMKRAHMGCTSNTFLSSTQTYIKLTIVGRAHEGEN
jgi:hypothetical protein